MVGKGKDGVGQALIRQQRFHKPQNYRFGQVANTVLESVIDVRDLDDVVEQAELAGHVFSTVNPLPEVLITQETSESLSREERQQLQKAEETLHSSCLKIPRRPKWHVGISPEELDVKERQSFLNWRRGLARLEENEKLVITPFEKNIDIWRQLWRVLERSDLVVMVVDARNPLFYRCPDLEAYVQEMDHNKRTILLLNKADLLPASSRVQWAKYLRSQGLSFLFWSAKSATATLEGKPETSKGLKTNGFGVNEVHLGNELDEDVRILDREELLDHLQHEAEQISERRKLAALTASENHPNQCDMLGQTNEEDAKSVSSTGAFNGYVGRSSKHVVVGFVGYPNVGKSSTINALVGQKRTGVTSTPGKTKHFQTLVISDKLTLCDCPGLVFPSFTSSRSDMVASGVLPIDRMTNHRGPVQVVTELITRTMLEEVYGIHLPKPKPYEPQDRPASAAELLITFARSRGYVSSSGLADETRAARLILKDYVSGKLLHYHLPPYDELAVCQSDGAVASMCDIDHNNSYATNSDPLSVVGDSFSNGNAIEGGCVPVYLTKNENDQKRTELSRATIDEGSSQFCLTNNENDPERTECLLGVPVTMNSDEGAHLFVSGINNGSSIMDAGSAVHDIMVEGDGVLADMKDNDEVPKRERHFVGVADEKNSGSNLSSVLDDLASFDAVTGLKAPKYAGKAHNVTRMVSSHKMHKKAPRRKDRSWRAGNEESDGRPPVRGVHKPVSYGAAQLSQTAS